LPRLLLFPCLCVGVSRLDVHDARAAVQGREEERRDGKNEREEGCSLTILQQGLTGEMDIHQRRHGIRDDHWVRITHHFFERFYEAVLECQFWFQVVQLGDAW